MTLPTRNVTTNGVGGSGMPKWRGGYGGRRTALFRELVQATYGNHCWLCRAEIVNESDYTIDHLIPLSRGGAAWDIENVRPAHARCNKSRGNRPPKPIAPIPNPSRKW